MICYRYRLTLPGTVRLYHSFYFSVPCRIPDIPEKCRMSAFQCNGFTRQGVRCKVFKIANDKEQAYCKRHFVKRSLSESDLYHDPPVFVRPQKNTFARIFLAAIVLMCMAAFHYQTEVMQVIEAIANMI